MNGSIHLSACSSERGGLGNAGLETAMIHPWTWMLAIDGRECAGGSEGGDFFEIALQLWN
jgi:hypothetical protein